MGLGTRRNSRDYEQLCNGKDDDVSVDSEDIELMRKKLMEDRKKWHESNLRLLACFQKPTTSIPDRIRRSICAMCPRLGIWAGSHQTRVSGSGSPSLYFVDEPPIEPSLRSEDVVAPGDADTQMGGQTQSGEHQPSQFTVAEASLPLPTFQTPSQGSEAGAATGDAGTQMGGQTQSGQHQPSQFTPAEASLPLPTFQTPIPDSLCTISDFINRMEGVFSTNDQPAVDLPSNPGGFPTVEALSIVLRRTQQLVTGGAATMLSHIAGRLEQESGSTDPSARSQIQNESVLLGIVMQHLGALFLELGRTILTLRIGLSPVESGINAGPAVYISSSGPNPMMTQPFPFQTSPLFNSTGSSATMGTMGPIRIIGAVPQHVSIHMHAGTLPLGPTIGAGPRTADGTQTVRNGLSGSGGSTLRASSTWNNGPGPVPARPACSAQPVSGVSTTFPSDNDPDSLAAELNMQLEALLLQQTASASAAPRSTSGFRKGTDVTIDRSDYVPDSHVADLNMQLEALLCQQTVSDGTASAAPSTTSGFRQGTDATTDRSANESSVSPADSVLPNDSTEVAQAQKGQSDSQQRGTEALLAGCGELSAVEASLNEEIDGKLEKSTKDAPMPRENRDHNSDRPIGIPLGFGLGGLQPKRSKDSKSKPKSDGGATSTAIQGQPEGRNPGQALQSVNRINADNSAVRQPQPANTQLDLPGMMSESVQTPVLNAICSNSGDNEMIPALGFGFESSNIRGRTRVEDRSLDQSSQEFGEAFNRDLRDGLNGGAR